jgi:hypothetical protein
VYVCVCVHMYACESVYMGVSEHECIHLLASI